MEKNVDTKVKTKSIGRTLELKILIAGFLVLSISGWMRFTLAATQWHWLKQVGILVSPVYLVLGGLLWGVIGSGAALGLLFRRKWAVILAKISGLFYFTWFWIDDRLVSVTSMGDYNVVFKLIFSLTALLYVFFVFLLPRQKRYFGPGKT